MMQYLQPYNEYLGSYDTQLGQLSVVKADSNITVYFNYLALSVF